MKCVFSDANKCLKLITWDEERQELKWITCGGYDQCCKHRMVPNDKRRSQTPT